MNPPSAPVANNWGSRSHVVRLVPIAATAVGIYLCYRLAQPFLAAFTWALALAVVFAPFHRWIESRLKRRTLAALVTVFMVGLIVVVPATIVGQRLALQATKGARLVATKVESGDWRRAIEKRPHLASFVDKMEREVDLPETVQTLAAWVTNTARTIVMGTMVQAIVFLVSCYLLFFFLRDRGEALQAIRSLSPLSAEEMDRLFSRVGDTIYATIFGTLTGASVQGLLGGLMFWWLGLPSPLLWGTVMGLLAVVPVLGAFVVWVPAAVFLAMDGRPGKAMILAAWGAVVVSGIDNLLCPFVVGNRMRLHTVLAFIAVVGGLLLFGPAGFILGPVVLTITVVLLEIWRSRTEAEATAPA